MSLVQLGGKVTPENKDRFLTLRGGKTWDEILAILMDAYESRGDQSAPLPENMVSKEAHLTEIQSKTNEIGRLQTAHTLEIEGKTQEIETLQGEANTKAERISELETATQQAATVGENQVLVTLEPVISIVLDKEAAAATRKGKGEFTRASILKNCFWETINKGNYSPYLLWSDNELRQLLTNLKNASADE